MHGSGLSSQTVTVQVEMIPAHSQPSSSKRKGTEDNNPLANTSKRTKKEASAKTVKRKLNGEEQPGGLVIVRAPSARPWDAQGNDTVPPESQPRATSRPPSSHSQRPHPTEPSNQPAKKFRADGSTTSARQLAKGKDRALPPSIQEEPEIDEDVRQMQTEADALRRKSQAAANSVGTLDQALHFPPPRGSRQQHGPPSQQRVHDAAMPLPLSESPAIERNRFMREGSNHRRKRSLSRGKRISSSYETTGVISYPHTSVPIASFHKHIDGDIPEPARARQLLIWCSDRAMSEQTERLQQGSSSKPGQSNKPGKDPPPLSPQAAQLLKRAQEAVIQMLAQKKIDTNVYGAEDERDPAIPRKENEQNVKNRARELKFNAHIQRSRAEDDSWLEVTRHYNAYRQEILAELNTAASAKAKGKQRASADQVEEWDVEERSLPKHFRGSTNLDLARQVTGAEARKKGALNTRLESLEYTMDRLLAITNSALETTETAEMDLDRRFALLNISLATRSQPVPSTLPPAAGALSTYLPPSLSRPPPTTDPQDLLRALSRIDASRPQNQVGDAARRAIREVRRATDAPGGMAERRLTGVPPPTPRKPPGTPRRAGTPGRGR
ncbi:hypothetical protein WOLCODRAFT_141197 [Wolfiporia cocos MD-104 SS10]|uniref:Mis12-Mtw1 protein family n=1 Tax=Wolfiporia cocos (strain MD-104) TaxID=742152 RepID=A0A2H3JNP2_WOLCO|nr:hypothetical protein WOLCODRAFT_141197 [Wolfiporia cocos MD-104 SS10]